MNALRSYTRQWISSSFRPVAYDWKYGKHCVNVMKTCNDGHVRWSARSTDDVNGGATLANGAALSDDSHKTADTKDVDRQEEVRRVAHERLAGRRRFYKVVSVTHVGNPSKHSHDGIDSPISAGVDGTDSGSGIIRPKKIATRSEMEGIDRGGRTYFGILLDGKRIRTPAGQNFEVPSQALAMAIAAEWDAQRSHINPTQMPLMTLACTAIDQTAADPEIVIQNCLRVSTLQYGF